MAEQVELRLDEYGFTGTGVTDEHNRSSAFHEHVHEKSDSSGFGGWNHGGLERQLGVHYEFVFRAHLGPVAEFAAARRVTKVKLKSSSNELKFCLGSFLERLYDDDETKKNPLTYFRLRKTYLISNYQHILAYQWNYHPLRLSSFFAYQKNDHPLRLFQNVVFECILPPHVLTMFF